MNDRPIFETINVSIDGAVARLVLARPERLNALSLRLMGEIIVATDWLDRQPGTRVVIVSGAGRSFSAGFDLADFDNVAATDVDWADRDANAQLGRRTADAIESMRPVAIAAMHGHVIGGGLVLAAACDLRVAADDTRFSIPELDLAIPLSWGGIPRLVRELGPALTKELVMTCRPFTAAEAHARGFLNRVVPKDRVQEEALELAQEVVSRPEVPVTITKRHVNAVARHMSGAQFDFADAGSLLAAITDPEAAAHRRRYIDGGNRET